MERSSSRRDLKAERLAQSPYSRPQQSSTKKATPATPFSTLRSIVKYVSSPFRRSPTQLPTHMSKSITAASQGEAIDVDQKSESGSEDEWNGPAPNNMQGQDVFALASAAGRDGPDFDERAEFFRARGEVVGGRRDKARRGIEPSSPDWAPSAPEQPQPNRIRPSSSMATLQSSTSSISHRLNGTLPSRAPLPAYTAPRAVAPPPTAAVVSASWIALTAYLDAKKGQQIGPEDIKIIDTLTEKAKQEANVATKSGGWSAGTFSTPRSSTLRNVNGHDSAISTPPRLSQFAPTTPGVDFSVGVNAPTPNSLTPRRKITYLGPGMSPRRLLSKPKPVFKPLFDDEPKSVGKKRRVEGDETLEVDSMPIDSSGVDVVSSGESSAMASARQGKGHGQATVPLPPSIRPSPLSQSTTSDASSVKKDRAIKEGRQSAMDIMREIIDEELGEIEATPDPVMINPYETTASTRSPTVVASPAKGTPRKSVLKGSIRGSGTPTRGAAEKLERFKTGRKLTTLETLRGERSYEHMQSPSKHQKTPSKPQEVIEIDELFDEPTSSAPISPKPPTETVKPTSIEEPPVPKIPQPDVLPPFNPPTLQTTNFTDFSKRPVSSSSRSYISVTSENVLAAFGKEKSRRFVPPDLSAHQPTKIEEEPTYTSMIASSPVKRNLDTAKIYLSAKDSALNVSKLALPFFTFTLPSTKKSPDTPEQDAAKAKALQVPINELPTFTFTLSTSSSIPAPPKASSGTEWTCSLCMLKNPATATEKCTICDAPKPKQSTASSSTATVSTWNNQPKQGMIAAKTEEKTVAQSTKPGPPIIPFQFAAAGMQAPAPVAEGDWRCGICGIVNSAKDAKCFVCEGPR